MYIRQETGADLLKSSRERRYRLPFQYDHRQTTEEQHAGKRNNEGGNPHIRNPEALPCTNERTDQQGSNDCEPSWQLPIHHHNGGYSTDKGRNGPYGQVDMPCDNDQHHTNGQD
ncbi:hypothetical protein D3C75_1222260 [compost metagenome]